MQSTLWAGAAGCVVIAGIAILGDHRRQRRRDRHGVGWMPWSALLMAALFAAAIFAALALHGD